MHYLIEIFLLGLCARLWYLSELKTEKLQTIYYNIDLHIEELHPKFPDICEALSSIKNSKEIEYFGAEVLRDELNKKYEVIVK